jgi:transcription elongation factor Elf1
MGRTCYEKKAGCPASGDGYHLCLVKHWKNFDRHICSHCGARFS